MLIELMQKINDRYIMALNLHRELADLFWFINLHGFAMLNEYQLLLEQITQRKLKRYITTTYHKVLSDTIPEKINIIEPLTNGKDHRKLNSQERWTMIKKSFEAYQNWEENSLKIYQGIAYELITNGEVSVFNYISKLIEEVKSELTFLNDIIIEMSGHNWDIAQITEQQTAWFERYEYLIKTLLGKSELFHHWNGVYDSNSRILFEKSPKWS